jgi:DNA repair protein RecO (recombination protein O)
LENSPEETGVPLYQSEAFVLRTYQLGEADQIVVLFTRDFGKVRAVARRSHSPRRHSASYYQPLMLLRTILFGRPSQALYRINTVDILQAFRVLHEDFERLRCGLYMTELLDVTTHEREPLPELFTLFQLTLEQIAQVADSAMLLRWFELRVLEIIGYTPQVLYCARCAAELHKHDRTFSPMLGGLICSACAPEVRHTLTISPATRQYLCEVVDSEAIAPPVSVLDTTSQQELEQLLHLHLTARLGRELKSYAFLHL